MNPESVRAAQALSFLQSLRGANTPQFLNEMASQPFQAQMEAYKNYLAEQQKLYGTNLDIAAAGPKAGAEAAARQPFELQQKQYQNNLDMTKAQYDKQLEVATAGTISRLQAEGKLSSELTLEQAKGNNTVKTELAKQGMYIDDTGKAQWIPGWFENRIQQEQQEATATETGKVLTMPMQQRQQFLADYYKNNVVAPASAAEKGMFTLTALGNSLSNIRTGDQAQLRLQLSKWFADVGTTLGFAPNGEVQRMMAAGELINKQGNTLGFEMARELGSRESQMVIQQAISSNPGLTLTPQGNQTLINLLKTGLQRDRDKMTFYDNWFQQHGSYENAYEAFQKQNPVEVAVSKVVPYQLSNPNQLKDLPPGTRYQRPNDKNTYTYGGPAAPTGGTP